MVDPAFAINLHLNGACTAQHSEVFGRQRLRNVELRNEFTHVGGTPPEGVQHPAPSWVGDHGESVHRSI
jgi:hypothetical protein